MIPFPEKKYRVIYADPAWEYDNERTGGDLKSGAAHKYDVMSAEEIAALPVSQIADDPCILLMWGTYPKLKEALYVIEKWGFEYKTRAFTWVKKNKSGIGYFNGMGFYTRGNDEFCLLATKGHAPASMVKDHGVSSLVVEPVDIHSRKPDIVRRKIVQLFGDVPRIELFSRTKAYGWDVWGNQLPTEQPLEAHF